VRAHCERALTCGSSSLYMACTACQNVTTQTWEFWQKFCDEVYNAQYPESIPLKTAVPHWAFLSYNVCARCQWRGTKSSISYSAGSQTNDTFNPVIAKSAGGLPEELAPVPSTVTLSTSSTSSGSPSTGSTNPTSTSSSQDSSGEPEASSSNVGAIVGIAVGSLAVLAAIGVGVWIFLRRRAARARVVEDHPSYPEYSAVASNSEHGMGPSQLRLYVSFFSPPCLARILTNVDRIHTIHPLTPPTTVTRQVRRTRPMRRPM